MFREVFFNKELDDPLRPFAGRHSSDSSINGYNLDTIAKQYQVLVRYHLKVIRPQSDLLPLFSVARPWRQTWFENGFLRCTTLELNSSYGLVLDLSHLDIVFEMLAGAVAGETSVGVSGYI